MIKYDEIDDMTKNSINTILERNGIVWSLEDEKLIVLKIPQSVPRLLSHPVTEQISSLSLDRPEATSAPLAC